MQVSVTRRSSRVAWVVLGAAVIAGCGGVAPSGAVPPPTVVDSAALAPSIQEESTSAAPAAASLPDAATISIQEYPVPPGSRPHDAAPAPDGTVWYTAQAVGSLGRLDPATGKTHHIPLGPGSAPHGVIIGPDGAAWVTDSGLNAIVRVDPITEAVAVYPLPADSGYANLNTAAFDGAGVLWFTGQSGVYGRLNPVTGEVAVFDSPRGRGPYGIDSTPDGDVYFVSLAGSYMARIDPTTDSALELEPPFPGQGARRVWADSAGRLWIAEWNAGQLGMYDPASMAC